MKTKTSLKKGDKLASKHGATSGNKREKIYSVWCSMRSRCKDNRPEMARIYKDKGIGVCERWNNFINFKNDMGEIPSPKHQIDRIDSNKGYEPTNCRWVTVQENCLNTSRIRWIEFKGQRKSLTQWAIDLKLNYRTLKSRIDDLKWPLEKALRD